VKDVFDEIVKDMSGIARGVYTGTNITNPVLYGYSATGTPRKIFDELSKSHDIEWRIDNDALYLNDKTGTTTKDYQTAPVISPETGLIDIPYYTSGEKGLSKEDKNKKK